MQRLPEDMRTALLLRIEGGLSYEEIAAVLEISGVSARVKVHRARLELARALKENLV
jgi:RNA polymerase sigma-70 factor (ECF subfamily)